ncbi:monofunctional biosynthetic peptidoglycan transglycosylase [Metallibacterium sp.]|uniref:monofunctional biosynthetic peptidoglycan transglycosylase n=1 Tax=Metallibacterium sp. TaxID=2940281 RepID=UPI002611D0CE|nr:monofunctional biosynthetic peptidoglycan transglycosylase [Metallibacterium sp.]
MTKPAKPRRRFWRYLLRALLVWFVITELLVLSLRWIPPITSAVMIERWVGARLHGDSRYRTDYHWVPWRAVSPWAPLAMVASEDQTFPSNWGFDFGEIKDAIDAADHGARLRGASTITQQTAKNLFLWDGRSYVRKGIEAYFTVLLTLNLPKQRILTIYMNIAELGNGVFGVAAASRVNFAKPPSRLTPREAALLAATLPNPHIFHANRPSPYVLRRAAWIEQQMRQLGGPSYLPK